MLNGLVMGKILKHLDFPYRLYLKQVCKNWKRVLEKYYDIDFLKINQFINWEKNKLIKLCIFYRTSELLNFVAPNHVAIESESIWALKYQLGLIPKGRRPPFHEKLDPKCKFGDRWYDNCQGGFVSYYDWTYPPIIAKTLVHYGGFRYLNVRRNHIKLNFEDIDWSLLDQYTSQQFGHVLQAICWETEPKLHYYGRHGRILFKYLKKNEYSFSYPSTEDIIKNLSLTPKIQYFNISPFLLGSNSQCLELIPKLKAQTIPIKYNLKKVLLTYNLNLYQELLDDINIDALKISIHGSGSQLDYEKCIKWLFEKYNQKELLSHTELSILEEKNFGLVWEIFLKYHHIFEPDEASWINFLGNCLRIHGMGYGFDRIIENNNLEISNWNPIWTHLIYTNSLLLVKKYEKKLSLTTDYVLPKLVPVSSWYKNQELLTHLHGNGLLKNNALPVEIIINIIWDLKLLEFYDQIHQIRREDCPKYISHLLDCRVSLSRFDEYLDILLFFRNKINLSSTK